MRVLTSLLVACALVASGPALAGKKNKTHGKAHQPASNEETITEAVVGGLISAAERYLIDDYIDHNSSVFHGAEALPPGIAKKVARGGVLPPGIAKRALPGDLVAQLPARPGEEWHVVGTDVVLVEIATKVIIDVLKGAL